MDGILYPTAESVIDTHARTVAVSGGGLQGVRDRGPLESTLAHIQNDDYYPTLEKKLTRLFFGLAKFHCFVDGNKRIAITATSLMLILNGFMGVVPRFMRDMENISVQVAEGTISEDLLHDIISAHTSCDPDNEEVKLKLFEVLSASAALAGAEGAPAPATPSMSAQSTKFIEAARELGASEDASEFDRVLGNLAKAPPPTSVARRKKQKT